MANGNGVNDYDSGDRVSASSGIASANSSSMPWLHVDDQELSGSSGECEQQLQQLQLHHQFQQQGQQQQQGSFRTRSRRSSRNGSARRVHHHQRLQSQLQQARSEVQHHQQPPPAPSPLSSEATAASNQRLPSPEQSCLTETTDCPSEVSVLTSISTVKNGRGKQQAHHHPRAQQGVVNAGASLSCEDLDGIQASLNVLLLHSNPRSTGFIISFSKYIVSIASLSHTFYKCTLMIISPHRWLLTHLHSRAWRPRPRAASPPPRAAGEAPSRHTSPPCS